MSLTNKFIIAILTSVLLVVSIFTYIQINEQKDILTDQLNQRTKLMKDNLNSNSKYVIDRLKDSVENDIASFNFSNIKLRFQRLVDGTNINTIALYSNDKSMKIVVGDELNTKDNFTVSKPIVLTNVWGKLYITYSLDKLNEEISKTKKDIKNRIQLSIRKAILTSLFIAFLFVVIGYYLSQQFINPIKLLTHTAKRIANGDLKVSDELSGIRSKDEIGLLAESFKNMSNKLLKSHEEIHELNLHLEQKVEEKTAKVTTLLDNAGQGFLTFDSDFIIDKEYSKECERLLGKDIANRDISLVLFKDEEKAKAFKQNVQDTLETLNPIARKAMISLLPSEMILNKRALKIEYKILDKNIMLVITNISAQKKLERKVKKEQDILTMIVTIMGDTDIFYDVKKDFEYFYKHLDEYVNTQKTSLYNINELYRTIHTFKGAFLQLFMNTTAKSLHEVESQLSDFLANNIAISNEKIIEYLHETDFSTFMASDLENINELLGQKFLDNDNIIYINKDIIKNIELQYIKLMEKTHRDDESINSLLEDIKSLSQKSLKSQLKSYPRLTLQIAQRLEKEIYEFEIIGDETVLVPDSFKPFIKSLIHLFRNSVDHGIETPEIRDELEKDEIGTISCSFSLKDGKLQLIISDDGAGINVKKLKEKLSKTMDVSNLSDEEIYHYIFNDNLSTKDKVSDISGRGVGMSAVKAELDRLNGSVKIQSEVNIGTTFVFEILL